jgi:hypothetical protein
MAEKTLRYDALQTTFSIRVDIFYPPNFGCFEKNGLFQQPRDLSSIILHTLMNTSNDTLEPAENLSLHSVASLDPVTCFVLKMCI